MARSIIDQLPNESILYVGDTAHGPYGPLPIAEVRANALGVMDELVLTPDDARHWSMALNDVRLVLAERLDIRDDEDAGHVHLMQDWSQAEDVESYLALVYNFTTWLQESLVQAMLQSLETRG